MNRKTIYDLFWTTMIVMAITALITAAYVGAKWIKTPLSLDGDTSAYITAILLICVAGGFFSSMTMFIWIGVRENPGGITKTAFYLPQLLAHVFFTAITAPGGIASMDRIYHHNHPQWRFFADAEVGFLIRLLYLCVLIISFQFTGTWVTTGNEDRRQSWHRVILGFIFFQVALILGAVLTYHIGGR